MLIDLNLKINNIEVIDVTTPIRFTMDYPIFSWVIDTISKNQIDSETGDISVLSNSEQSLYEIRISDSNLNIGTNLFEGNMVTTGSVNSQSKVWKYIGPNLERGNLYYGQINIVDDLGRESGWISFSLKYNSLPVVSNVSLSPQNPTFDSDLKLSYNFYDADGDEESIYSVIRWFKNGVHQKYFDNLRSIESSYTQIGDIWMVDILPFDGYEYGERKTSSSIRVIKASEVVTFAKILPENPNENDILKADYVIDNLSIQGDILIRWFFNDVLFSKYNNKEYVRHSVLPGDKVRFEIKSTDGDSFFSSPEEVIQSSEFSIYNITIDGQISPLEVSTIRPVIGWESYAPYNKEVNYVSIKIGTFYESQNIYNTIIEGDIDNFTIPFNILEKGIDYYVSIAVSDIAVFNKYSSAHFRTSGSRWNDSVDNSTGWTIETIYLIDTVEDFNPLKYHIVRINDGTRFGEIRLYNNKIGFISNDIYFSDIVSTSGANVLTIVGKGDDVKIYLNRTLVLDATGKFIQSTSNRQIEIGNSNGKINDDDGVEVDNIFIIKYKYFYYTTSGSYYPGENEEYANINFHTFSTFADSEVVSLRGYTETVEVVGEGGDKIITNTDKKVFAVNPDRETEGGYIYSLSSNKSFLCSTVGRSFSPINRINISPNGKKVVFAHTKGFSVISGYLINPFDHEIDFVEVDDTGEIKDNYPDLYGWNLVKNTIVDGAYFNTEGLNINTLDIIRE